MEVSRPSPATLPQQYYARPRSKSPQPVRHPISPADIRQPSAAAKITKEHIEIFRQVRFLEISLRLLALWHEAGEWIWISRREYRQILQFDREQRVAPASPRRFPSLLDADCPYSLSPGQGYALLSTGLFNMATIGWLQYREF